MRIAYCILLLHTLSAVGCTYLCFEHKFLIFKNPEIMLNTLSNFIYHQVIERKKRTKTNIHWMFSSTLPYDEIRRIRRIKFQLINGDAASIEVLVTRYLFSIEPAL